jgi:hypothetical protein
MAATAPMAFGGLSNGFGHEPRHIPVRDEDVPETHEAPLTGYMIDPRYLRKNEASPDNSRDELPPDTTVAGKHVPPLVPLDTATHHAVEDEVEYEHWLFWRDWRHIIFPLALLLFITALGVANMAYRAASPPASGQINLGAKTSPTVSPSPTTAPTPAAGGRGGGESPAATPAPTPLPSSTAQLPPQSSGTSSTGTATQPATNAPLVGGRGGGGDTTGIIQPSSLGQPTPDALQGK